MLFDKAGRAYICGMELSFTGSLKPSVIDGFQPFNNSTSVSTNFQKVYHGKSTVAYQEESIKSPSGPSYKQQMTFRFLTSDSNRAVRIETLQKIKLAKLMLSNGLHIVIGRNDYFQNTLPVVSVSSDQNLTTVEVTVVSMFSAGYIPNAAIFALPAFVPYSLLTPT